MKKHLLVLLILGIYAHMSAQLFEGFEVKCGNDAEAFLAIENCYPDWINTSGTADTDSNEGFAAFEGDQYATMYVVKDDCGSGNSEWQYQDRGEGIAVKYNFIAGNTYKIKYQVHFGAQGQFFGEWIMANGLSEQTGNFLLPECQPGGDFVPPAPTNSETAHTFNWFPTSQWTAQEFDYSPTSHFSALWLRLGNTYPLNNTYDQSNIHIDAFEIIDCSEAEAPSFYTMDEDGNVTSSFCYGEDVRVCINSGSADWSKTTFYVLKQPAGSFYTRTNQLFHIEAGGCYNLSQFIRDRGNVLFEPGYSYSIKMSVYIPGCGWRDSYKTIWVDCCEEGNADFAIDISGEDPTTRDLKVTANRDYTYYGDSQKFCLSSDEDLDGIYDEVFCSDGASFDYVIDICIPYKVTHTIDTRCGDYESSQDIFIDEHCEDCAILDFSCNRARDGSTTYSWIATPDAESYEVSVVFDDFACDCGSGSLDNLELTIPTENNFHTINGIPCISIRVRSICEDGSKGEWSDKICPEDCSRGDDSAKNRSGLKHGTNFVDLPVVTNYPNPFDDYFQINIEGALDNSTTYRVFDISGNVISKGKLFESESRVDVSGLSSGTYLLLVQNGDNIIYADRLIKQ